MDLEKGESFGFLGFEFRRIRSRQGRWMPLIPKAKKRTALLGTLKIFRRFQSQPVSGDRTDQSDPSRLGELLCDGSLQSVFRVHPRLG